MERLIYAVKSNGRKTIFVTLIIALLAMLLIPAAAISANGRQDRQKIVEQIAAKWTHIGTEQYERGLYNAAVKSFLKAKDYQEYLSTAERDRLDALLERAQTAASESNRVSSDIAMAQLYNRSIDYYNSGRLEEARAGFLEVAKSGIMVAPEGSRAEDYLARIDAALAEQVMRQPTYAQPGTGVIEQGLFGSADEVMMAQPGYGIGVGKFSRVPGQVIEVMPSPVSRMPQQGGGYIEVIKRRQSILRSHTEAVVNDALAKARSYQSQNNFDQATKSIEYAQNIVNKNRLHLGEQQFARYSDELQRMRSEIDSTQAAYQAQTAEQARIEAEREQQKVRAGMMADRQKRVAELMQNTLGYQKQQRYEEALGQLQSLIAIDPLNQQALIMKDTLEDTIAFRNQLQVVREQQREREELLLESSKSEVPYAREMTISKDWLEISAKRVPEEAIGQDPATARVYEQLEQIVDLSELGPDMPFGEAIEILKNSVDPPLKIVAIWRDLYDNADIDQSTAINMDPISSVRLASALKFLLKAVSGGFAELGYGVENGIITIATKESIPADLVTLVYDVTDLVGSPAEYRTTVSGGQGGGGGGVSDVGGGFRNTSDDQDLDADTLREEQLVRINDLILLIQDTVMPDSWFDTGGEGAITSYGGRLLSIRQTAEVHNQVSSLLHELRKAHGYQVAIEARFLKVSENFLEDIGLDIDFLYNPGGKWSEISFSQSSAVDEFGLGGLARSNRTGVEGSLGGIIASTLTGGYGTILDDLQVSFVLSATQAHGNSTLITAPKATVLSGESATFRVQKYLFYAGDIEIESRESAGEFARGLVTVNYEDRTITSGTILNISPTITPDKKHVLLNIDVTLDDFLGFRDQVIDLPAFGDIPGGGGTYTIEFPEVETAQIRTRVSVPDGGTLLLGGQKLGAEVNKEVGVPILSKIPILGRAFGNRSKVKDHKILLILVKPTIILQDEIEAEAIAEMQNGF